MCLQTTLSPQSFNVKCCDTQGADALIPACEKPCHVDQEADLLSQGLGVHDSWGLTRESASSGRQVMWVCLVAAGSAGITCVVLPTQHARLAKLLEAPRRIACRSSTHHYYCNKPQAVMFTVFC